MGVIYEALTQAINGLPGRTPRGFTAQVRALGGRGAHPEQRLARIFGVTPRTARGWLAGRPTTKGLRAAAQRATDAVTDRRKLKRAQGAVAAGGMRIETRGTYGYNGPPGSSDESRSRRITASLPGHLSGPLFAAYAAQDEAGLSAVLAAGIGENYFRDGNRRAHGLEVELTEIDYMDINIQE